MLYELDRIISNLDEYTFTDFYESYTGQSYNGNIILFTNRIKSMVMIVLDKLHLYFLQNGRFVVEEPKGVFHDIISPPLIKYINYLLDENILMDFQHVLKNISINIIQIRINFSSTEYDLSFGPDDHHYVKLKIPIGNMIEKPVKFTYNDISYQIRFTSNYLMYFAGTNSKGLIVYENDFMDHYITEAINSSYDWRRISTRTNRNYNIGDVIDKISFIKQRLRFIIKYEPIYEDENVFKFLNYQMNFIYNNKIMDNLDLLYNLREEDLQ